jgi:hypothetical protein
MRRIVRVDQLRQPQRTSHAGRAAANDDHISRHLRPLDAFDWFAEDQHWILSVRKACDFSQTQQRLVRCNQS